MPVEDELDRKTHCERVFTADHGREVDIWSVGHILHDQQFDVGLGKLGQHIMDHYLTLDAAAVLQEIEHFARDGHNFNFM
jgi:hypothetical protein